MCAYPKMNTKLVFLNKVQTNLIFWDNPFECNGKDVIVCITGNPGIPDFYIEFAAKLHEQTNFPVCIIGQAGHSDVPDNSSNSLKNQHHLFNLDGQLKHKMDLIDNIDKKSKIHIIGHSIGAWEVVEIMDQNEQLLNRVASVNLLFPTLQKMADTKNGTFLNNVTRRLHMFHIFLFYLVSFLPNFIVSIFINLYLKWNSLPLQYNGRIKKFLNPSVGEKVLFLAYDEMDRVKALNSKGIEKIKHMSNVIYSIRDNWAPLSYIDDLKVFQPPMKLVEVDINHTFVLKSSIRVAEIVIKLIMKKNL